MGTISRAPYVISPTQFDANPLLKQINVLQDQGREVMSFTNSFNGANEVHFAYLRKKKA